MALFISPQLQSETVFRSQVQASIKQIQLTAPHRLGTQTQLVRTIIMRNNLLSGLQTNRILLYQIDSNGRYSIMDNPLLYGKDNESFCSCQTDLDCGLDGPYITNVFGEPSHFNDPDHSKKLMVLRGLNIGCMPVDSIFSSTLECLYNQTCLDEFISFFPTTEKFTAMIKSEKTRFGLNSRVKVIVDDLMLEEWMSNISYDKYYTQCAPNLCSYSIVERHDFLFVLMKLIRLLGGLTLIFSVIIPRIVQFMRRPRTVELISCKFNIYALR